MATARTASKMRKDKYAYRNKLPFMSRRTRALHHSSWWNVTPTGDYVADFQTGKEYATAFWRVCGGRPTCGLELGEILFAMHDRGQRRSHRWNGLSGIEIGFIRTIGTIIDLTTGAAVLAAYGPRRLASGKARVTNQQVRNAAKFTNILLEAKHAQDQKFAAEIKGERLH